ncbi:MAG: hypothetical protein JO079_05845 [Frankiaceae bacterium]|nr:hypothetical protein [Frankiaceae bacterium]MBV9368377.1 hypothetical protein [Frankiales bacterium]
MQAYVFGNHTGEPPTHLVGNSYDGVTVQSMTALEGAERTLFTKLHLDNEQVLSAPRSADDPVTDLVTDAQVIVGCHSPDCLDKLGNIESRVAFIGIGKEYYCFIVGKADDALKHLPIHAEQLGPDRIAAATDGKGNVLVELAGDDLDELRSRAVQIADHPAMRAASIYVSRGMVRAPR